MENPRRLLLETYTAGLAAVEGGQAVFRALAARGVREPCHLVAIGKAAQAMLDGALRYYGAAVCSALLITKHGHARPQQLSPQVQVYEAAHPVPDATSLQAGAALLQYLQALPAQFPVLFLISGGASSLVEVLAAEYTLADLQLATQTLLANGAAISEINGARRQFSRIKGGKLWQFLQGRQVSCLLLADVPGDDPALIGSGLLFPPPPGQDFTWEIVANNRQMLVAMAEASPIRPVTIVPEFLQGDAVAAAHHCIHYLRQHPPGLYLWGAETTVMLPHQPGQGGRNQHLALTAALHIRPNEPLWLLAAGTDGTDGNTNDAGALVDAGTFARGWAEGLDPAMCLQRADAGTFLAASGDLVSTGSTGTNVMDVVLGLKQ